MQCKSFDRLAAGLAYLASLIERLLEQVSSNSAGGSRGMGCKSINFLNMASQKKEESVVVGVKLQTYFLPCPTFLVPPILNDEGSTVTLTLEARLDFL